MSSLDGIKYTLLHLHHEICRNGLICLCLKPPWCIWSYYNIYKKQFKYRGHILGTEIYFDIPCWRPSRYRKDMDI